MNFYRNSQSFEQNVDNLKGPRSGPWTRLRREGSKGKVDGASPRGFLRFLSLTAFQAEGYGGGFAASFIKRGAADAAGCVEGLHKKGS